MSARQATARARTRARAARARDTGQVTVEFLGMIPLIVVTLVVVWQLVLLGYTYTLAGNAADEAVRAGTAAGPGERDAVCREAGTAKLSDAWRADADVSCGGSGYVTADVTLHVPVLFPGAFDLPFTVHGHAGAVEEEDGD
ncbi:TadE/TadG family type IV pilus assembly protein [Streptomyces hilarionis]|uniref:TadE/TadG family type IV pilus assembly protein n=1 Tax=Streptomyces hilarionis TaxID=2839954 RepID=UPI002119EBBA|nr:TadE/TadG family type IV pilus assembly protein [Streptomyces hilarionis]MCQ9133889.1 pilus assembly protein [Streptomyces hilarionis]